jgi:hypothetical protein
VLTELRADTLKAHYSNLSVRKRWCLLGAAALGAAVGLSLDLVPSPAGQLHLEAARAGHPMPGQHKKREAKPFRFGNEPVRQRKNFADLSDDEVKLLCDAIGCMRDGARHLKPPAPLSIHDPLQWETTSPGTPAIAPRRRKPTTRFIGAGTFSPGTALTCFSSNATWHTKSRQC